METQANEPSGESQEAGLLDSVSITEDQGQQASPSSSDIEHREEQDDDTPLERPDWWPENFWKRDDSSPDLEGIAKSWQDLRKQIAQGKHKPPADGKYDTSVFGDIPEDDPVRGHVMGWAKEYGISQAALDKLVGDVVAMNGEQAQQVSRTIEEERKALGPNADAIIKGMGDWGAGLVRKGILSKDDFEEFKVMGGTEITIPRAEVRGSRSSGQSLMPEGLEAGLGVQEMADLLTFIETLN